MILPQAGQGEQGTAGWAARYGDKHRLRRVKSFPQGIAAPRRVRIYARRDWYVLQFWDASQGKTLNQRVDGDLLEAILKAREIDQRLAASRSSGCTCQFSHQELVDRYVTDLQRRCDAGEVDAATTSRYRSAIERHYLPFCHDLAGSNRKWARNIGAVDREFQMALATCLLGKWVTPNGHANGKRRKLSAAGRNYVMDCVKAMYQWAADSQRGALLPAGFENPFLRKFRRTALAAQERITAPEVTVQMAAELLSQCDAFQFPVFSCMVLFGLRPSELSWLFWHHVSNDWISFNCCSELDYFSKGRQNKRFPLISCLGNVFQTVPGRDAGGFVFRRRRLTGIGLQAIQASYEQLIDKYHSRYSQSSDPSMAQRRRIRDQLMTAHGILGYNTISHEFAKLARQLNWPSRATLKDLRHLFSTSLENAGVPEYFRKYLMGHSFGRSAIVTYTHLSEDKLRTHYLRAIESELGPVVEAIAQRGQELSRSTRGSSLMLQHVLQEQGAGA